MAETQSERAENTRERIRAAALRLFVQQGVSATSIDAILAEAGISSKETLYRHYASKEALFVDVLSHLMLFKPRFSSRVSEMPRPHDLASLELVLTSFAREVLSTMSQPEYLAMLRMIFTEAPRFPQLASLFRETVTQQGLAILTAILRQAKEQQIIADVDVDAVTRALLGGLVTYALSSVVFAGEEGHPPPLERADAVVQVIMKALTPTE